MVTKNKPETLYGVQNFGIKKIKKNIDMVTQMGTLFICMFNEDLFLYATHFYTLLVGLHL